jgi:molybdopterin molybdotransferase
MQEECEVQGSRLIVRGFEPKGGNIRFRGEEIRKGRVALRRGVRLSPGAIAWLATMGVRKVTVLRKPRVGLLRTGNEVVDLPKSPGPVQVRDAHGLSLRLALGEMGIGLEIAPIVRDNAVAIRRAFSKLMTRCDVVLTTGGVSVGRHDLIGEVARGMGIRPIFHKIAQKPGKPMAFGARGPKLWFGLPGNPVSSLFCFYCYVRPALVKMSGRDDFRPVWFEALAASAVRRHPRRAEFMRGRMLGGRVGFAVKQGSHCLGSFARSNLLVRIDSSLSGRRVLCLEL